MKRLSSLGLKVLTAYVAGALVSIALAVAGAAWMVRNDKLADLELRERAQSLVRKLRFDSQGLPQALDSGGTDLGWLYDSLPHEAGYRVLDANGRVVLLSKAGESFWPADSAALRRDPFIFERGGVTLHGATEPFEHQGRQWYLQFATSTRLMKLVQHKFALPYLGAGIGIFSAVLIVVFGLCAYLTLRHALKPLHAISTSAAAISTRSLHARLQTEAAPAEISPLVDSFNRVLQRLEHGYRLQQEFLANAAHELKTPLALIRAQIELPTELATTRESLLNDVDYMTRQVQQLLLLAEASEVNNYSFGPVALQDVAREAAGFLRSTAERAEVRLELSEAAAPPTWTADRGALFTLLKNLLENAIEHAPAGSSVHIDMRHDAFSVRDFGPGVDAEQLPQLFARFWRGAHRRDLGAGLGLAICQEIALAHGWHLTAQPAQPGLRLHVHRPGLAVPLAPHPTSASRTPAAN